MMPDFRHCMNFRGVGVENPVIVGLAILRERFVDLRIGLEPRRFQPSFDHAKAAEWKYRTLEWLIGLKANDHLIVSIDISCLVRQEARRGNSIHRQHAGFPFLPKIRLQRFPNRFGAVRRTDQKRFIAIVRLDVAHDEIAHIDARTPATRFKGAPTLFVSEIFCKTRSAFHSTPLFRHVTHAP